MYLLQFKSLSFVVSSCKRLVRGAIPTLNLPVKSIPATPVTPRRKVIRQPINLPVPVIYQNLDQFKRKILPLKLKGWSKIEDEDSVVFEYYTLPFALPKFSL